MSNCHVEEMLNVYVHLFKDVVYRFVDLKVEFERDLLRLRKFVASRGIGLFVRDLPNLGKHFDRCLANGQYIPSGLPLGMVDPKGKVIPVFLRGLLLLVFDESGCLKKDVDTEAVFFLRQFYHCMKKAELYCGDAAVDCEIDEFIALDASLPAPEQCWTASAFPSHLLQEIYHGYGDSPLLADRVSLLPPEHQEEMSRFLVVLDKVSSIMCSTLGRYNPQDWQFKHGPGAISDTTKPTNKYSWTNWSVRLDNVYPISEYGFYSYKSWVRHVKRGLGEAQCEPFSRLIDVPKTFSKPRLIAAEPREHQWCQQNIWHYFRSRVRDTWLGKALCFTDQRRNQDLCLSGSVDGSLCTVDLSAASDRVTCHVVGQFFRSNPELLRSLQATRTQFIQLRKKSASSYSSVELRKFSTMGSACTFPVESLLFLAVSIAVLATSKNTRISTKSLKTLIKKVSVFGDDIIVPKENHELLCRALEVLYFKVNTAKSFWNGNFRESCGVDAYKGVDVTPAYWRSTTERKPESIVSKVAVVNNFYQRFLFATSSYLTSTLPRDLAIPPVKVDSGVFGLKSSGRLRRSYKKRWNKDLQKDQLRVLVVKTSVKRTLTNDASALFQFFTEQPDPHTKWTHGYNQRPKTTIALGWVDECTLHVE